MIIFRTKPKLNSYGTLCRSALEIRWFALEWVPEYKHSEERYPNSEWRQSHRGIGFCINKNWLWGSSHWWYDGEHCFFDLGFLHIWWAKNGCKKCHEDGFGNDISD